MKREDSKIVRKVKLLHLSIHKRLWLKLPAGVRGSSLGLSYGRYVYSLVCLHSARNQSFATYFFRNRPELELLRRLLDRKAGGSTVDVSVVACSKGAEVYSILWSIRRARPDLRVTLRAVDISQEILDFAESGLYSREQLDVLDGPNGKIGASPAESSWNTRRDQYESIFHRMTGEEMDAMFQTEGYNAKVRPWLKEGSTWLVGDAFDPELVNLLGLQDIVVANRFICHMQPDAAEICLRNVSRLVKPGGYLFVQGMDLDVRTKVAKDLGWTPVTDLIQEIHDGDCSLRNGWPLNYWAQEPFFNNRPDWQIRYASVFQIGEEHASTAASDTGLLAKTV